MSSSGGDDRFLKVKRDPRFWEMPEKERRIKIDKRFKSMFTDKRFKLKYTVDKRGRPVNHTSTEDLKRFYNLSDTEEDEEDEEETTKTKVKEKEVKKEKKKKVKEVKEESGSVTADQSSEETQKGGLTAVEPPQRGVRVVEEGEDADDDDDGDEEDEDEAEQRHGAGSGDKDDEDDDDEGGSGSDDEDGDDSEDSGSDSEEDLARGIGNIETSSDEDDYDDQQGGAEDVDSILRKEEEEITHDWGELCKDAPRSEQISSRLAVCNMDWDKIKAKDLLFVFNSFKPKGGVVISVKIYPSEFGKERRELERSQGPMELMALPEDPDNDSHEQQVYREKLRDYQFKRLQYFYAVVECDSPETADSIYQSCDRSEYESSCSVLDLRFIPDEVSFEEEEPTDVATEVGVSSYTPKMFTCAASGTSTVKLTWDENDHDRVTALSRDFKKDKLLDMDFQAYLASSSEEEGEGGEEGGWGALEFPEDKTPEETKVQEVKEDVLKPRQKKQRAEQQISKYRELLKGIQDKEKKHDKHMEMEVTWTPGLRQTTEQLVKQKQQQEVKGQLTPWEEYLEKKKNKKKLRRDKKKKQEEPTEEDLSDDEVPSDVDLNDPFFTEELGTTEVKKKKTKTKGKKSKKEEEERTAEEEEELENRKAEMALLMDDAEDGERKHFNYDEIVELQNLSKKKRKNLKKNNQPLEDDSFQVDVKDPRFQAVFTSALFNLDPSDPHYKKTKATQSILEEKERRRHAKGTGEEKDRRQAKGTDEEKKKRRHEDTAPPTPPTQEAHGSSRKQETEGRKQEALVDPSLSMLVKNIKSKTQQFQARKKHKAS